MEKLLKCLSNFDDVLGMLVGMACEEGGMELFEELERRNMLKYYQLFRRKPLAGHIGAVDWIESNGGNLTPNKKWFSFLMENNTTEVLEHLLVRYEAQIERWTINTTDMLHMLLRTKGKDFVHKLPISHIYCSLEIVLLLQSCDYPFNS